jgi:hypothetical protein
MNFFYEKQIIIKKNSTPNFIVTHEENLPPSYKQMILKTSIEGISKAVDFLDITKYVADTMNEFDGDHRWQCICGYRDSFNITGPEEIGIAFNLGNFKFVVYK